MSKSEFAKRQLKKHGWTEGSGLGKQEDGRSEPIKVTLKMDKTGVGHDPGKEFTDHWWLRVFNETAQQIGKQPQDGSAAAEEARKKKQAEKRNFYKGFVKSSVLTNGVENKEQNASSSSEDESETKMNSSIPTLDDIHEFCGGATGHRAARFGIKMKGKLSRVASHDKLYEEKMGKFQSASGMSAVSNEKLLSNQRTENAKEENDEHLCHNASDSNVHTVEERDDKNIRKKKKKKYERSKSEKSDQLSTHVSVNNDSEQNGVLSASCSDIKSKKKKKRKELHEKEDHVDNGQSDSQVDKISEINGWDSENEKKRKKKIEGADTDIFEDNNDRMKKNKKIRESKRNGLVRRK